MTLRVGRLRQVEQFEKLGDDSSNHRQVDATMRERLVKHADIDTATDFAFSDFCNERSPWRVRFQSTAASQHRVAQRFSFKPTTTHPPPQCVSWIDFKIRIQIVGPQLITARRHKLANQRLDRPSVLGNEPVGQVVEQFRVRGRKPVDAKVVDRLDQPPTEHVLPYAVHDHARGERVLGMRQPLSQFQPPALPRVFDLNGERQRHTAQEPAFYDVALSSPFAAKLDRIVGRLGLVANANRKLHVGKRHAVKFLKLSLKVAQLVLRGPKTFDLRLQLSLLVGVGRRCLIWL